MGLLEWFFAAALLFGVVLPFVARHEFFDAAGWVERVLTLLMMASWPYLCFFVVWRWI